MAAKHDNSLAASEESKTEASESAARVGMTLERFQGLVLKLGNQMFVRHYLWVNYPNDPQSLGIQFSYNPKENRRHVTRTCDCGQCKKCRHREYVRNTRAAPETDRLYSELRGLGFQWNPELAMWIIQRERSWQAGNSGESW